MNARHPRPGLLALVTGVLLLAPPAFGIESRYIGSVNRVDGPITVDNTLHSYDASMRESFSNQLNLDLRMSLRYQKILGEPNTNLLNGRFYGDLRGSNWRLRGQLNPWQDLAPGGTPPRGRTAQLGFNLAPRGLPQLDLNYTRGDQQTSTDRTSTDDRRGTLSYSRGILSIGGGYREVKREISSSSSPGANTKEWKADASITPTWRSLTFQSAYEFLSNRFRSAARVRDFESHTLDLSGGWQPSRKLSVGGTALLRATETMDNGTPLAREGDERSYGARAGYLPWNWLDLQVSREYRSTPALEGYSVTDYTEFQATVLQYLRRQVSFQAGYQKYFDNADQGAVPSDNLYAQVEGPLRRGLMGRLESRVATSGLTGGERQWRQVAELRGDPIPEMHMELGWRHDSLPDSGGPGLTQREWSALASFAPESALGLLASYRSTKSERLVKSEDRLANLLVTWRRGDRGQLSFNWSRRHSLTALIESEELIYGLDFETWLPGEWKISGSTRQLTGLNRPLNRTLSLSVEKNF